MPTHHGSGHHNRFEGPPHATKARPPSSTQRPRRHVDHDENLTVAEVCAELKVARSTFYDWRTKRRSPRCLRLPNGDLRIRRSDLDAWLKDCELPPR
jgi:excisionase family DNA binding protein